MAHLLGTGDGVSYRQWQAAMLKKEEEFEQNGVMTGQTLANDLYGKREDSEAAFQATTMHQTFRGSGFGNRRGGFGRNRGSFNQGRGRVMNTNVQRGFNMQRTVNRGGARVSAGAARGYNGNFAPRMGHGFSMVEGIHMQQGHVIHAGKRGILQRSATLEGSFKDIVIIAGSGVTKEANVGHKK